MPSLQSQLTSLLEQTAEIRAFLLGEPEAATPTPKAKAKPGPKPKSNKVSNRSSGPAHGEAIRAGKLRKKQELAKEARAKARKRAATKKAN